MLNLRMATLALATGLGLGLTACGSPGPQRSAAAPGQGHPASEPGQQSGRCPRGHALPAGEGEAIDYIDFFQLNGRSYDAARIPVGSSQLGQVIGRIRCSLIASENLHRGPAAIINGTASFLPAGAPVYWVHGYPSACRLAAYLHGQLQVYIAQASVKGRRPPGHCPALRGTADMQAMHVTPIPTGMTQPRKP
jgi:hypothetical protein